MPGKSGSRRSHGRWAGYGNVDPAPDRRSFHLGLDGAVEVWDPGGAVLWSGRVLDCWALAVRDVGDEQTALVLLDWDRRPNGIEEWHPFENLVRIDGSGSVVWRAELVHGQKSYVGVASPRAGTVLASDWSGQAELDIQTGSVLRHTFTK